MGQKAIYYINIYTTGHRVLSKKWRLAFGKRRGVDCS